MVKYNVQAWAPIQCPALFIFNRSTGNQKREIVFHGAIYRFSEHVPPTFSQLILIQYMHINAHVISPNVNAPLIMSQI